LEQLLTSPEGPVARGEKFIVFSTMFREGVTESGHKGLKERYEKLGFSKEYKKLELNKTLDVILREAIEKNFKKRFEIGVIDGTIKVEEREKIIDSLHTNNYLVGIVCTTDTGGESLDLTSANWVYFLDEDYVPDTEEQALGRLLRKGQKKKVFVHHLRARETFDIINMDRVDSKREIAKMSTDGVSPTEDEWKLMNDVEGKGVFEEVRKSVGGKSINVYDAQIQDLFDFEIKKRTRGTRKENGSSLSIYETTDAQKVNAMIGRDPLGCWMNPEFVELYMKVLPNLSPHVVNVARVCDLISRAKLEEINFPRKVLADASGPSMLYNAYQVLQPLLKSNGFKAPYIIDRDISKLMLEKGSNPNKVLGCMTGKNSSFKDRQFEMVDNGSISLLENPEEVYSCLLESHRILKHKGLLELIVKGMKFEDSFYSEIEKLGFELISEKNEGFSLSREAFRRLRNINGRQFAESYAAKLADTYFLLARKVDDSSKANPKDFWFKTLGYEEPEESIRDLKDSRSILIPGRKRPRGNRNNEKENDVNRKDDNGKKVFTPKRKVITNSSGLVIDVEKINENGGE
ncbi:MAG: C-terminal helicase domain-containing protein, partial [Nanoarchaeota archaeon]